MGQRHLQLGLAGKALGIPACCAREGGGAATLWSEASVRAPREMTDAITVVGHILGTSLFRSSPQLWLLGLRLKLFQEMARLGNCPVLSQDADLEAGLPAL